MKINEENFWNEYLSINDKLFPNDKSKAVKIPQKLSAIKHFVNDTEEKEKITHKDKNKG